MKDKFCLLWLLFVTCLCVVVCEEQTSSRDERFLSVFNVIKFKNNKCNRDTGICYTKEECIKLNGRPTTSLCANGFGVCCEFISSCGGRTEQGISYFTSPRGGKHPYSSPLSLCTYNIELKDKSVSQIRLDFESFHLAGPHCGECEDDYLTFLSADWMGISKICGINDGQHIYIPVDKSGTVLSVTTSGGRSFNWKIKVTQVSPAHDPGLLSPVGCLQYFTKPEGVIESLNYQGGSYFKNLHYAICIRRCIGTCKVRYRASKSDFTLRGKHFYKGKAKTDGFCADKKLGDYLVIPEASDDYHKHKSVFKICSDRLSYKNHGTSDYVTSYANGPIYLLFHTDDKCDQKKERGFRLRYRQLSNGCAKRYTEDHKDKDKYKDKDYQDKDKYKDDKYDDRYSYPYSY